MAKGVGKTILAAAKLLSNPVGAVASVFRKKKGLKRGPTAASAGLVRRRYKGRAAKRAVIVNDGQGNARMARKIGRQPRRLNKGLESKIRDMLQPTNHHLIEHSGNVSMTNGKSHYKAFEMMNATDIDEVIAQSSAVAKKYNGKLNIQNAKMQVMLRNQTTNLMTFRVYEYICRRDVPDKLETSPGSGVEEDGTTYTCLFRGWNYQQTAQITQESIGGTLFQNPLFCTYYKILKVRTIQIGAGKCFNLSMSNLKARSINPLVYNASDGDVLAGLTRGFVLQSVGSLVSSDGHSSTSTTGFINYDFVVSRKYGYNQPYWGEAKNTINSDVPQPVLPQYHINEYTGASQIQAES